MSKFSEIIGSFSRMSNFPIEANYVFPTETALKEFYEEPVNKITLHRGLFKIVEDAGNEKQALYWVTKRETSDELVFVKLIEDFDVDNIYLILNELQSKVNNVPDLFDILKALVGTQDDIIEYLNTLPYKSLTEISNALNQFLNEIDSSSNQISTLPELKLFLDGYTKEQSLKNVLDELYKKIAGSPNKLTTIEAIERSLLTLTQLIKNRCDNLQSELDQTQIGVGLSGDGSYNADSETYYLQNATSVMNALKILDRVIHKIKYLFKNTASIQITETNDDDLGTTIISADVKIAEGSDLKIQSDGLYYKVEQEYKNGVLSLKVNGEIVSNHNIGLDALVEDSYYSPSIEALVFLFKLSDGSTQRVEIPTEDLITEWEFKNNDPAITMSRERVIDGADEVSAVINISTNDRNIITKKSDGLYAEVDLSDTEAQINKIDDKLRSSLESLGFIYLDEIVDQVESVKVGDKNWDIAKIIYAKTRRLSNDINKIYAYSDVHNTCYTTYKDKSKYADIDDNPLPNKLYVCDSKFYKLDEESHSLKEYTLSLSELKELVDNKVDKEDGKGLSTNDFDDLSKSKIDNLDYGFKPQSFTFDSDNDTYNLNVTRKNLENNTNVSLPLPLNYASSESPGIMSIDDKSKLDQIVTANYNIVRFNAYADSLTATESFYDYHLGTWQERDRISISIATSNKAGVMSASDKTKLDSLDTTNKQLSTEDFTTYLKQKLEGLTNYDDSELSEKLEALKSRLDILVGSDDVTSVIDTFQEIETFLQGITNTQTLTGLLQEMKSDIIQLCTNTYLPNTAFRNDIDLKKGDTGNQLITTEEFVNILKKLGAFSHTHWEAKCTWKYANNDIINDTGCGNICLAGSVIEVWNINSTDNYTIRIITAPAASSTGGIANAVFIYRNQGSGYNPGWKRLANIDDTAPGLNWTSHSTFDTNSILGTGGGKIYVGGGSSKWSNLPSTTGDAHAKTILNIPVSTSTAQLFFNSTGNVHYRVGNSNSTTKDWKEFAFTDFLSNLTILSIDCELGIRYNLTGGVLSAIKALYDSYVPFIIRIIPTNNNITSYYTDVLVFRKTRSATNSKNICFPISGGFYWGGGSTYFVGSLVIREDVSNKLASLEIDTKIIQ